MAEAFLHLSSKDRLEALGVAATISGRPLHLLEKDVWVVWALAALFESRFAVILSSKVGRRYRKPTRRSGDSRRTSMLPMTFASWSPTLLAMPWKHCQPTRVRKRNGQRRSGSGFQFGLQSRFYPSSDLAWRRLVHQLRLLLRVSPYLLRTKPLPAVQDTSDLR